MTSIRKPSTPRSSHQFIMSKTARRTSGFSQLRSGCLRLKMWRKYSRLAASYCQAGPEKADPQFVGSAPGVPGSWPSRAGRHQYQSRFGLSGSRELSNQACSSEVWLTTRSMTSLMPRSWSSSMSLSMSSSVPNSGSMSW